MRIFSRKDIEISKFYGNLDFEPSYDVEHDNTSDYDSAPIKIFYII